MTLHKKTLMIIGVTLLMMLCIGYGYLQLFFLGSFRDLEEETVTGDLRRALNVFSNQISNLSAIVRDYAGWDDTYAYIEERNPEYIRSNYIPSTLENLRINLVIITDADGAIVYEQGFDLVLGRMAPIPPSVFGELRKRRLLTGHTDAGSVVAGILLLPEGPILLASRPIVRSDREGPIRGSLIIGRKLDAMEIQRLSTDTNMSLSFYRYDDLELRRRLGDGGGSVLSDHEVELRPRHENAIDGYTLLRDIYGSPAVVMCLHAERPVFQKGQSSALIFIVTLAGSGLIFALVMMYLLERLVLSRVKLLSRDVAGIGGTGDLRGRVTVRGHDELAGLAQSINGMLGDLAEYQKSEARYVRLVHQLETAHQQLKDIIAFLPDATIVVHRNGQIFAWNQAVEVMTGARKEEMIGEGNYAYAVPFYGEPRPCLLDIALAQYRPGAPPVPESLGYEYIRQSGHTFSAEVYAPALAGGKGAHLMVTASVLFDGNGQIMGAIESIRDITEQKKAKERQVYMRVHDSLTGLYNRTYFEQLMAEWDQDPSRPVGLILCDVDGLKSANDTFGHEMGDQLLLAAAEVLRRAVGADDVLARVGGDEFAVLSPGRTREELEVISLRIRDEVEAHNLAQPQLPLSLSAGYAVHQTGQLLRDVFQEADNNMYRTKLHHSRSNRSTLVTALMKALEARDFATEGHAERMQGVVARMGMALGLSEHRLTDLRLLAQFHDIGKVGIPDRILFKKGPLTADEYTEMKLHCEIGHRIAQLVPELAPIADCVLKHHERWDGKGYPLGLKGEEIPLDCRILAIADAYDAMMSDRPYRKALPLPKVIAELHRCAGTQFDPRLTEIFIDLLQSEDEAVRDIVKAMDTEKEGENASVKE